MNILSISRFFISLLYGLSIPIFVRLTICKNKSVSVNKYIVAGISCFLYNWLFHPFLSKILICFYQFNFASFFLDNLFSTIISLFLILLFLTRDTVSSLYLASFICFIGVFSEDIVYFFDSMFQLLFHNALKLSGVTASIISKLIWLLLLLLLAFSLSYINKVKLGWKMSAILVLSANVGNLLSYAMASLVHNNGITNNVKNVTYLLVFLFVSAFSCFSILWYNNLSVSFVLADQKNQIMQARISEYKNRFIEVEEIRKEKHDYTKKLQLLAYYINENQINEAKKYLESYLQTVNNANDKNETGNSGIDMSIAATRNKVAQKNIRLDYEIELLDDITVPDEDIVMLLLNICDNAVEAIEESDYSMTNNRVVVLTIVVVKGLFIIRSKNYCSPMHDKNTNETFIPLNTDKNHGLGQKIIKEIVCKYSGYYNYDISNNTFKTEAVLIMRSQ